MLERLAKGEQTVGELAAPTGFRSPPRRSTSRLSRRPGPYCKIAVFQRLEEVCRQLMHVCQLTPEFTCERIEHSADHSSSATIVIRRRSKWASGRKLVPVQPVLGMTPRVCDRKDKQAAPVMPIDDAVRETTHKMTAIGAQRRTALRVLGNECFRLTHGGEKREPQTRAFAFVPPRRTTEFGARCRMVRDGQLTTSYALVRPARSSASNSA